MAMLSHPTLSQEEVRDQKIIELIVIVDGGRGAEEDLLVGWIRGKRVRALSILATSQVERSSGVGHFRIELSAIGGSVQRRDRKS